MVVKVVKKEAAAGASESAAPGGGTGQVLPAPRKPQGLIVTGFVLRRTRRIVGDGNVVVAYTIGPRVVTVEHWNPEEPPYPVGADVSMEVTPNIFNGRVSFQVARNEEEF